MEGPRSIKPEEIPSLGQLLDTVFSRGKAGEMFRFFPVFLAESNAANLFVYTDKGRVVSHVGTALHWASIAGCTVGVACVGAVATYEEYRGKGLATQLMDLACRRARAWGADFMMISGGRGLYRRLGAADVGCEHDATVSGEAAERLAFEGFALTEYTDADFDVCQTSYDRKIAHFIRPRSEWSAFLAARVAACTDVDVWVARVRGAPCGYWVAAQPPRDGEVRVIEFAGDAAALSATLHLLLQRYSCSSARLHLQAEDMVLRRLLVDAGAELKDANASGTYLLLDADRLIRRLTPFFEARVGRDAASTLQCRVEGDRYLFACGGDHAELHGKAAAAEFIFGNRTRSASRGCLGEAFPVPPLWYGLNYV